MSAYVRHVFGFLLWTCAVGPYFAPEDCKLCVSAVACASLWLFGCRCSCLVWGGRTAVASGASTALSVPLSTACFYFYV